VLRIPAALSVLGLTALALVGCASSASSAGAGCSAQATSSQALALVEASGAEGSPSVSLSAPVYLEETAVTVETVGDGRRVTSDEQDVQFTVAMANGATGQEILTSGTQVTPVSGWGENYRGIAKMLMCATEGSRLIGAMPYDDMTEEAASSLGLEEGQVAAVVLDLQKVYPAAADGEPQYNDRGGMPSVVLAPNGAPGIIIPDVDAPTDLAVEVLKKGDGPEVGEGDSIRLKYTGVTWDDSEVFDSTWEDGASVALSLDGVVEGFAQALEGATVGSQILAVIPPELGYGEQGSGAIPGGATLVFVIDVLGIDDTVTTD
jgi:hypothetical protein